MSLSFDPQVIRVLDQIERFGLSLAGPFDCVFFDADRVNAPEQLRILLPKLEPDVLLLTDNALSHPQEVEAYITAIERLPGFVSVIVPVGKGLHIA